VLTGVERDDNIQMGLGESRRNKIALELESTYYMLSILKGASDSLVVRLYWIHCGLLAGIAR